MSSQSKGKRRPSPLAPTTSELAELPESPTRARDLAGQFERRLHADNGWEGVRYATDVNVRTEQARADVGLSAKSAIWPLKGDGLPETKYRIPGIQLADYMLYSINLLFREEKIWVVVRPDELATLEEKFLSTRDSGHPRDCSQFMRHTSTFIPMSTLDRWDIQYHVVSSRANEAVITFPGAYHGGFSAGHTVAEAVNHTTGLFLPQYKSFDPDLCPAGSIPAHTMHPREEGEEQVDEDSGPDDGDEH
ncbi:MAG: hypothetical protein M1817_001114 [Caeruleum heppii]|nr:MAG: hypothetical protein M1817_001114 [Caeruleum heppii]